MKNQFTNNGTIYTFWIGSNKVETNEKPRFAEDGWMIYGISGLINGEYYDEIKFNAPEITISAVTNKSK